MSMTYSSALKANAEKGETGAYSAGFSDFIAMKILASKRTERFGNVYGANAYLMAFSQRKELVCNLDIRIDAIRLAELDAVTEILNCNKQEFVLELIVAGIEQAKQALTAAGLQHAYDEVVDEKIAEVGISIAPSASQGCWTLHHNGEPIVNQDADRHGKAANTISDMVQEAATGPTSPVA